MFKISIKKSYRYIKPLLTGTLFYGENNIQSSINSLIVLNELGDVLTCAHIADSFLLADEINEVFNPIIDELKDKSKRELKKIEEKYGLEKQTIINVYNILVDISKNIGKLNIIKHPYLDLAVIRLENTKDLLVNDFPVFVSEKHEIGSSICNIGFAFPEYEAFALDEENKKIEVTNKIMNFPLLPLDGIITRNIIDVKGKVSMFETSRPALPGQSGGAVFNTKGEVLGMLIGTKSIKAVNTNDYSLNIDLGFAINSLEIISFLNKNNIPYYEADKKKNKSEES